MVEEIQEKLQENYTNIQIEVEYVEIRKYKIKLLKKVLNHNIIKRSVTFEYNWQNNFTFSSNIEQIKSIINTYFKLYLEREEKEND